MVPSRRPRATGLYDGPSLVWAICTVARSGSSWLSQLIASTHVLGIPDEYLLDWPRCCSRWGLSTAIPLEEFMDCLIRHYSTPNGVFAIKGSFAELQSFWDVFPSAPCVWLSRENKVEQAVSWHRAHDCGLWHLTEGTAPERTFQFSVERSLRFYDEILRREALWKEFFSARDVRPLVLTYEELCRDPLAAVRAIAAFLGIEQRGIDGVTSSLRIIRDEKTADYVRCVEQALQSRRKLSVTGPATQCP